MTLGSAARCTFIVVGWSGPEVIETTVGPLIGVVGTEDRVILVDNKSAPSTRAWVETKKDARLEYLDPGGNRGFAGAINAGVREVDRTATDWIVAMSDDALLDASFRRTLDEIKDDASIGIVGPVPRRLEDKSAYFLSRKIDFSRSLMLPRDPPPGRFAPTDYVEGRCLAFRAKLVEELGPFDESFFIWLEDVDFCVRAARHGNRVVIDTEASVFDSEKTGAPSRFKIYLNARNRVYFALKHASPLQAASTIARIAAIDAARFLGARRPDGRRDLQAGPDLVAAAFDGIKLRLKRPADPRAAAYARFERGG